MNLWVFAPIQAKVVGVGAVAPSPKLRAYEGAGDWDKQMGKGRETLIRAIHVGH